jgi:hypothetical protein
VTASRVARVEGVSRLFAVGDVQSNYAPLLDLLAAAGFARVHDGFPVWTAGDATLLFLGDLLDGGPRPAEVLWLVIRLHEQAAAAGGRVALVQGNHELMLFDALAGPDPEELVLALSRWFANGGLETLLLLAASVGIAVPEHLIARMFTATLERPELDEEVQALARSVQAEYASEVTFLKAEMRPAVLVNGRILAVHGAPNFEADDLPSFVRTEADELAMAWSRGWLEDFEEGAPRGPFPERLASLKTRLDDPARGVDLRCVLVAHTPLAEFSVPGFRDRQFRIGRLAGPEQGKGVPVVFDLMTAPREVPRGGALGGLLFEAGSVSSIYGAEVRSEGRVLPARETVERGELL